MLNPSSSELVIILNTASTNSSSGIPAWGRDKICSIQLALSGLMIQTQQYGLQPWFELAYQCLSNPADRQSVRDQKKLNGDTHQILEFFTNGEFFYPEPGTWLSNCYSPSAESNPDWFYMLCLELIQDGIVPIVVFDGDNGDNPADGYPNALRQLPLVVKCLDDLSNNVLYARFWDGVWYGSDRSNIEEFGIQFRTLKPNGCLALEMQVGVNQMGDDVTSYGYSGILRHYDVICNEFDSNVHQDSTWQIVGRMVYPYNRPPDEPSGDDPRPPYFYGQGNANPRGRYYWIAFENKAYEWVRNRISQAELASEREYFRAMGAAADSFTRICW
jgi:hypothetical protein